MFEIKYYIINKIILETMRIYISLVCIKNILIYLKVLILLCYNIFNKLKKLYYILL